MRSGSKPRPETLVGNRRIGVPVGGRSGLPQLPGADCAYVLARRRRIPAIAASGSIVLDIQKSRAQALAQRRTAGLAVVITSRPSSSFAGQQTHLRGFAAAVNASKVMNTPATRPLISMADSYACVASGGFGVVGDRRRLAVRPRGVKGGRSSPLEAASAKWWRCVLENQCSCEAASSIRENLSKLLIRPEAWRR